MDTPDPLLGSTEPHHDHVETPHGEGTKWLSRVVVAASVGVCILRLSSLISDVAFFVFAAVVAVSWATFAGVQAWRSQRSKHGSQPPPLGVVRLSENKRSREHLCQQSWKEVNGKDSTLVFEPCGADGLLVGKLDNAMLGDKAIGPAHLFVKKDGAPFDGTAELLGKAPDLPRRNWQCTDNGFLTGRVRVEPCENNNILLLGDLWRGKQEQSIPIEMEFKRCD